MQHGRSVRTPLWLLFSALMAFGVSGCPSQDTSLRSALRFLETQQKTRTVNCDHGLSTQTDFPGNWPQEFYFDVLPDTRIPEVSPFVVCFIHHALAAITEEHADILGMTSDDVARAQIMRRRAADFIRRFEARPVDPDAATFGFWPYDEQTDNEVSALEALVEAVLVGPRLFGPRVPLNLDFYPRAMGISSDADTTATAYAALLDGLTLDGGAEPNPDIGRLFAGWRDTGESPRRNNPPWLPPVTGAFLTWLNYRNPPDNTLPNDLDLVVNANVLYALARFNQLDTPGAAEAIALVNHATEQGLHQTHYADISLYYPDNFAFHYCVSRAYFEGPVPELAPAVKILAADLEASAQTRADGAVYWDKGDPHLNTAFAVLTLLNAQEDTRLVGRAIDYLVSEQDPWLGSWRPGVFFSGQTDGGLRINWNSSALTTAMALEALCRYRKD
ncbi:MAG: hypothetical protein HY706_20995 [Candidatus Hydrogenedentes bacterium]|nr:hypothetical protein [Candidatus Hydrogenedentota bacterium]